MGLKLSEFLQMGMHLQDLEELRGLGIKYLEATDLFDEPQRQSLISIMIRFKDQVQQIKAGRQSA
jgi:hypothetical protein